MRFLDLGTVSFENAWRRQEALAAEIAEGAEETVLLLEHPPLFTAGRGHKEALPETLAGPDGGALAVHFINRGGDVTFHGPGQMVAYAHLDLRRRGRDLHRYLRDLESVLIRTAAAVGVRAGRREGLTGVWTERAKLASIGIGVRRWITLHGAALNVTTDLSYFERIDPCGIPDCPMTSLEAEGVDVEMAAVKKAFEVAFHQVF